MQHFRFFVFCVLEIDRLVVLLHMLNIIEDFVNYFGVNLIHADIYVLKIARFERLDPVQNFFKFKNRVLIVILCNFRENIID
jgi:hypothetical protein